MSVDSVLFLGMCVKSFFVSQYFPTSSSILLNAPISPNTEERTEGLVELLRSPCLQDNEDEYSFFWGQAIPIPKPVYHMEVPRVTIGYIFVVEGRTIKAVGKISGNIVILLPNRDKDTAGTFQISGTFEGVGIA